MANHFAGSNLPQDGQDPQARAQAQSPADSASPHVQAPSEHPESSAPLAAQPSDQQGQGAPQAQTTQSSLDTLPSTQHDTAAAFVPAAQAGKDAAAGADAASTADASASSNEEPAQQSPYAQFAAPIERKLPANAKPVISLHGVSKVYPAQPNKPALQDVSLDVYPGEFVFLVGHSGSGKSTFIKLLTRELKASSGQVMVAGQDLTKMRNWKVPYLRRQIGCVFQDFKLLPDKTTYENVAFALECIGKPRSVIKAQVPEVLRLVGLAEKMDAYPDQLSGGEQQRVSVARAMVNRPPLLVCDEPTGNLDPAISLGIMKLLDRINRAGTTVIMATHDREMVDSMRKRVIALEAGHIIRDQERGGYGNYGAI